MSAPATVQHVITLAGDGKNLFALREDGAVFVLVRRGDQRSDGTVANDPSWQLCPPVPGTIAAFEAAG